MSLVILESLPRSRLKALVDHFGEIDDPREPWRVDPALFSAAFTDWVRETWLERPDLIAIDGKTSRRNRDRAEGTPPLHLVSAFATTARLVLGQEAVPDKASETTAIPALIARLSEEDGLKGALVLIDAVATNPAIAATIREAGADYLLAVKANQARRRQAQRGPAGRGRRSDVRSEHGLPVACDPEGPAATLDGPRLSRSLGLRRDACADSSRALPRARSVPGASRSSRSLGR